MSYSAASDPPTDVTASLFPSSDNISISWTPPSGGIPPTGYMIYYEATAGGSDAGNSGVISGSPYTLSGRTSDEYTIMIVALSAQLPSTAVQTTAIRGES